MASDRNQPDEQFAVDLAGLLKDIEEYKQFARSGQDSVRMYRIFSQNASDKTMTNVQFRNTRFRLTFEPADQGARGLVYKMEYTFTEASGPSISSVQIDVERENVDNSIGVQTWLVSVSGSDFFPNPLVTMKFYFWASGEGTFYTTNL
ncbi:MAG TPA: hypothetical protein PLM98_17400 [Thiolinea sp.]|jgi:hypothetical protein|nr:hypothetical protein [Thiolinea sp.]